MNNHSWLLLKQYCLIYEIQYSLSLVYPIVVVIVMLIVGGYFEVIAAI